MLKMRRRISSSPSLFGGVGDGVVDMVTTRRRCSHSLHVVEL